VYTQDIECVILVAQALDAKIVMANDHTAFRVDGMPFTGHHTSILVVGGIPYIMEEITQNKLLVIRT